MLKTLLAASAIVLTFASTTSAQKTTLVVGGTLEDCPEFIPEYTRMIQGIRVFEIPSNRLIYQAKFTDSSYIPRSIEIPNAKVGGYRISYSINPEYNPYQDKYITLKAIPTNYVNFCKYDKKVEPINIFSDSKIGDSILIENSTTTCFNHFYSKTYLIHKKLGWTIQQHQYKVDCGQETKSGKIEVSKKPIKISKSKVIKSDDIANINLAINKIRMFTIGGCTKNSMYTISYQKRILNLYDGSCEDLLNDIIYAYTGSNY